MPTTTPSMLDTASREAKNSMLGKAMEVTESTREQNFPQSKNTKRVGPLDDNTLRDSSIYEAAYRKYLLKNAKKFEEHLNNPEFAQRLDELSRTIHGPGSRPATDEEMRTRFAADWDPIFNSRDQIPVNNTFSQLTPEQKEQVLTTLSNRTSPLAQQIARAYPLSIAAHHAQRQAEAGKKTVPERLKNFLATVDPATLTPEVMQNIPKFLANEGRLTADLPDQFEPLAKAYHTDPTLEGIIPLSTQMNDQLPRTLQSHTQAFQERYGNMSPAEQTVALADTNPSTTDARARKLAAQIATNQVRIAQGKTPAFSPNEVESTTTVPTFDYKGGDWIAKQDEQTLKAHKFNQQYRDAKLTEAQVGENNIENLLHDLKKRKSLEDIVEPSRIGLTDLATDQSDASKVNPLVNFTAQGQNPYMNYVSDLAKRQYEAFEQAERQNFNDRVVPELRGRFRNSQNSSGFQNQLRQARNDLQNRLGSQRTAYDASARDQMLKFADWGERAEMERRRLGDNAADKYARLAVLGSDTEKHAQERLMHELDLKNKGNALMPAALTGIAGSHDLEGAQKHQHAQLVQDALHQNAMNAHPAGPMSMNAATAASAMAAGQNPGFNPLPPPVPAPAPQLSSSAQNAVIWPGIATVANNYMQGQAPGYNPNQQQQQRQYAQGGHVSLMDRYKTQLSAYEKAKERHGQSDFGYQDPAWKGLGDVTSSLGEALTNGTSMLGGWAKGIGNANNRFDESATRREGQSKERTAMEKVLADLYRDAAHEEEGGRHNLATETETGRSNRTSEAQKNREIEALAKYRTQLMEKDNDKLKAKEMAEIKKDKKVTETDLTKIKEADDALSSVSQYLGDAAFISAIADKVPTGVLGSFLPPFLRGAGSKGATGEGLDMFKGEIERFDDLAKSDSLKKVLPPSQIGRWNENESNVQHAQSYAEQARPMLANLVREKLRRNGGIEETARELELINKAKVAQIIQKADQFAKANGQPDKADAIKAAALKEWNKSYELAKAELSDYDNPRMRGMLSEEGGGGDPRSGDPGEGAAMRQDILNAQMGFATGGAVQRVAAQKKKREDEWLDKILSRPVKQDPAQHEAEQESILGKFSRIGKAIGQEIKEGAHAGAIGAAEGSDFMMLPISAPIQAATGVDLDLAPQIRQGYVEPEKGSWKKDIHAGIKATTNVVGGALTALPVGKAIRAVPGAIKVGQAIAKASPKLATVGKFLHTGTGAPAFSSLLAGRTKDFASMLAPMPTIGGLSSLMQDKYDLHPAAATIASTLLHVGGPMAAKTGIGIAKGDIPLSPTKRRHARNLRNHLGAENLDEYAHRIHEGEAHPYFPEGYHPTTAELTHFPAPGGQGSQQPLNGISEIQKAFGTLPAVTTRQGANNVALQNSLQSASRPGVPTDTAHNAFKHEHTMDKKAVTDILQSLEPDMYQTPQDVGAMMVESAKKWLKPHLAKRSEQAALDYDLVKTDATQVNPSNFRKVVERLELEGIPKPWQKHAQNWRYLIGPNATTAGKAKKSSKSSSPEMSQAYEDSLQPATEVVIPGQEGRPAYDLVRAKFEQSGVPAVPAKGAKGKGEKAAPTSEYVLPRASDLAAQRQSIANELEAAIKRNKLGASNGTEVANLTEMLEAIDLDLGDHVPAAIKANKNYAENSRPINEFNHEDPLRALTEHSYGRQDNKNATLADPFLRGRESRENMQAAKRIMGQEGPHVDTIGNYGKQDLLSTVVDPYGSVMADKIKPWKKTYGGALEAVPTLEGDLTRLEANQRTLQDKFGRKNLGAVDRLSRGTPEDLTNEVINSAGEKRYNARELLGRLAKMETDFPQGKDSFANGFLDHMRKNVSTKEGRITPAAYSRYVETNMPLFKEIFDPDQIKIINNIGTTLDRSATVAKAFNVEGSHTQPLTKLEKDFMQPEEGRVGQLVIDAAKRGIPFLSTTLNLLSKNISKTRKELAQEAISDLLTDSQKALKQLNQAKNISDETLWEHMRKTVPPQVLSYLIKNGISS